MRCLLLLTVCGLLLSQEGLAEGSSSPGAKSSPTRIKVPLTQNRYVQTVEREFEADNLAKALTAAEQALQEPDNSPEVILWLGFMKGAIHYHSALKLTAPGAKKDAERELSLAQAAFLKVFRQLDTFHVELPRSSKKFRQFTKKLQKEAVEQKRRPAPGERASAASIPTEVLWPRKGAVLKTTGSSFAGTAAPGATVTVLLNDKPVGTTTADAGGSWLLSLASPLADGSYAVHITVSAARKRTKPFQQSGKIVFSIDSRPLPPPAAATMLYSPSSSWGFSADARLELETNPWFTSVAAGATLELSYKPRLDRYRLGVAILISTAPIGTPLPELPYLPATIRTELRFYPRDFPLPANLSFSPYLSGGGSILLWLTGELGLRAGAGFAISHPNGWRFFMTELAINYHPASNFHTWTVSMGCGKYF